VLKEEMMSEHDLDRREFLKRGAALGGALVWATPVVQLVGMRPALAQVASPACNVWYAAKVERPDEDGLKCDTPGGAQDCLDISQLEADLGLTPGSIGDGCDHIASYEIPEEGAANKDWKIVLDEDCQFVHGSGRCYWKTATACSDDEVCTYDHATRTLTFAAGTQDISHVEFAFCCEE
jgi:hypothetical protein